MILHKHQSNADLEYKTNRAAFHTVSISLLLVAITLAVYWPVTRFDFVSLDDLGYFTDNSHVQEGLTSRNMIWAFTTSDQGNWHPLIWLSYMLDVGLFGKGPTGPHFTNLLFHLANTVLLFLLLRRLTAAQWRSAFVAALFALHPLHVESVAWISERKDVLSTFFGMLSLLGYARYVEQSKVQSPNSKVFYGFSLFFFVMSLMSKPMLVTLPFMMLLLDWWPLRRIPSFKLQVSEFEAHPSPVAGNRQLSTVWRLVLEKWPFLALSSVSCVVTLIAQEKGGAVITLEHLSMPQRVANAFISYARYLGNTFYPTDLATPYPYPGHWPLWQVGLAMLLFACLCIIALRLGRKFPFVPTGWFWFVGMLIPVIGLIQVGNQSMADRYTYMPLIGLFVVFAWGAGELCARWHLSKQAIGVIATIILAVSALRTQNQVGYWKNSDILFRHAIAVTKNNYLAYKYLGFHLSRHGQPVEAINCYLKSLQISPGDPDVLYNLGNVLTRVGDLDKAIDCYRRALQITPNQADILNNLGFALTARKQFDEAITCYNRALQSKSDYADAHNNLATALFMEKRFDEAARHYREALHLTPDDPRFCANLGDALVQLGQMAEAAKYYQEALRLKPDDERTKTKLRALGVQIPN
jgi:tetratricopeptide (TPR) repeat protein